MDLGIIGNCQYSALIDPYGDVKWLCWPRFDSSFVFGGLIDKNHGGFFRISPDDGEQGRQAYIPNSNVLVTTFETERGTFEVIDFAPRFMQYERYYKPKMLVRIVRPIAGKPMCKVSIEARHDYGKSISKMSLESNHIQFHGFDTPMRLTTNAPLSFIEEQRHFVIDRSFYFALTYGVPIEQNLAETCENFLEKTRNYWQTWVKHSYIPECYQSEVIRSALVLKLHQYEDTGAIIAATTTSIPEAKGTVRNWDYRYCWLRDAVFSLTALQRLTQFEELEKFILYLHNIVEQSRKTGFDLQPVYGISGEKVLTERVMTHLKGYQDHQPVRVGNQAYEHKQYDVYGEMLIAISPLFLDQRFTHQRHHLPTDLLRDLLNKIEEFIETEDAGLWELRGKAQLHTFTILMHWAGAHVAEKICQYAGGGTIDQARRLKKKAKEIMDSRCWNEEIGSYTQAAGTTELDASLLMLINMGFLGRNHPKAIKMIDAIRKDLSHGNGFLHRYRVQDDFGETNNAFLICSFWLVEALVHAGNPGEARELFEKLLACSNHLGLYSEDFDPQSGELWGNFPQTYSHVGLINAAFSLSPHSGHMYLGDNFENK
ncbi:MAG: glycoside hydrolase family 15 protein [Oligoflexus sp.]